MGKEAVLPKNVRQIGDIQGSRRIYMEDYVMTYIHRKECQEERGFLGVFLGERQETESGTLVFIRGLVEVPDENMEEQNIRFPGKQRELQAAKVDISRSEGETEGKTQEETAKEATSEENGRGLEKRKQNSDAEDFQDTEEFEFSGSVEKSGEPEKKRTVLEECREFFGPSEIQGCCVIGEYPVKRMERLAEEAPQSRQFLYHLQEQEETLYWAETERYEQISGYFVFYEQNKEMQEYMAEMFEEEPERNRVPDEAIKNFRAKIRKKDQVRLNGMLKLASSFLVVAVLLVGAVVVNRIEARRGGNIMSEVPENEAQGQFSPGTTVMMRSGEGTDSAENTLFFEAGETAAVNSGAGVDQTVGTVAGTEQPVGTVPANSVGGTDQTAEIGTMADGTATEVSATGEIQAAGDGSDIPTNSVAGTDQTAGTETTADGTATEASAAGEIQAAGDGSDIPTNSVGGTDQTAEIGTMADGTATEVSATGGLQATSDGTDIPANSIAGADQTAGTVAAADGTAAEASAAGELQAAGAGTDIPTNSVGRTDQPVGTTPANSGTGADQTSETMAASAGTATEVSATGELSAAENRTDVLGTIPENESAENRETSVEASARQLRSSYVIREGDTLADICQTYYGNLNKLDLICEANKIEDANMITPGQKIVLP